jgi:hypothetical protein
MPAQPIDSKLIAVGKDERAMSVSGYVHQGRVKIFGAGVSQNHHLQRSFA